MKKTLLVSMTLFFAIALVCVTAWGQVTGDYRSLVTPGTWTTTTHWETYNGSAWVTAGAIPAATNNVTVRSGHTMNVPGSGTITCKDLTVENSGAITSSNVATAPRYIKMFGNFSNSGTFGGSNDGLSLNFNNTGPTTISGSGTTYVCRIQPQVASDITFGTDVNLTYTGGSGVAEVYCNGFATTYTISAGKTVTCAATGYLSVGTSGSSDPGSGANMTVNVYGTLTLPNNQYSNLNLRNTSGNTTTLHVYNGGTVNAGYNLNAPSASAATAINITVDGGGAINCNGSTSSTCDLSKSTPSIGGSLTVNGILDCSNATSYMTGAGSVVVTSGGTLKVGATAGLDATNGPIRTTTRNFNAGASYVYNGTSAQVTGSDLPSSVNGLTINNSTGITLSGNVTVNGALTLTSGNITTGANTLSLGSSASISGEGTGKYVVGNLATTKAVGTGASTLGGIGVSLDAGGADDLGNVSVTRVSGSGGAVTVSGKTGINRKWTITSDNPPAGGRTLTLSWVSDDDNSKDLVHAQIWKSTDAGSTWGAVGAVTDVSGTRSIGVSTTSFSQWTVSDGGNPLPVELTTFTALVRGSKVELSWNTATEVNNYGFEIERAMHSGLNGLRDWAKIGFVEGHGTTNAPQNYSFSDNSTLVGKYSYRLKQIDRDGKFEYSKEVEAAIALAPNTIVLGQNYPNPFNPETYIEFAIPTTGYTTLKVYNMLGEAVSTLVNGNVEAGVMNRVSFKGGNFASGLYFYTLRSGSFVETKKMMMMK